LNEKEKRQYLEEYQEAKTRGVQFFPDIIFKDMVVAGLILVALISLIVTIGIPIESRADPTDASYLPRPEWYFLWVFELLKYFPGSLEVVATVVMPVVGILLLLLLPFYDRNPQRHPGRRPVATGLMTLAVVGMAYLTYKSVVTSPVSEAHAELSPEAVVAQQFNQNCAACHSTGIVVRTGSDLHRVIAEGLAHEGMPAWGGDFTSEEIDKLVSYISAPNGAALFRQNCASCHDLNLEVPGGADELHDVIAAGSKQQPHEGQDVADWGQELARKQINSLANFVLAPQPRKLYENHCAGCHGTYLSVAHAKPDELREAIQRGGKHRTMPAWKGELSDEEIATLASFIADPNGSAASKGKPLFEERCSQCHGDNLPSDGSVESIRQVIMLGGPHETMPAWGEILSPDEIGALIQFILAPPSGIEEGQKLFAASCTGCHGKYGEGGPNPARPGDIIHPISTSDFLTTRDDETVHAIIAQGQPNLGMVPFSTDNGGPLDDEQIDYIVAFMRSWESNPPVKPAADREVTPTPAITGQDIFARTCAQCHGENGEGSEDAPPLNSKEFLSTFNNAQIRRTIVSGMEGSSMWAWGDLGLLSDEQVDELVAFVRSWEPDAPSRVTDWQEANASLGDEAEGEQYFASFCSGCHGTSGERQVSGIVLHDAMFLRTLSDPQLVQYVLSGGKQMPAFHSVLTRHQVNDVLAFIRTWQPDYVPPTPAPTPAPTKAPVAEEQPAADVSFADDVLPILGAKCVACHGSLGGWSATDYDNIINGGDHGPVVVPGDPNSSLLVQRLQGTGGFMPPGMPLPGDEVDLITSWIQAGALDN